MQANISGIYVINLKIRQERWHVFRDGIHHWEQAFGKTPQRLSAVRGIELPGYGQPPWFSTRLSEKRKMSWGGKAGCILSHRNAIQNAHDRNWDNVLVLEDDAYLTDKMTSLWISYLGGIVRTLEDDWSVINFCTTLPVSPCRVVKKIQSTQLVEAAGCFGAVAYLLNGRIFSQVLNELPKESDVWRWVARHKTIDRWFSQNLMRFGKVYFFAPAAAGHRSVGSSDTSMSAENDCALDFELKGLRYINNQTFFEYLMNFRRYDNWVRRRFSLFRQKLKQFRGL